MIGDLFSLSIGDLSDLQVRDYHVAKAPRIESQGERIHFEHTDIVVHAAARAHIMRDDIADPLAEYRKVNRDATLTLARMVSEAGVKRFVFVSSIGVNGNQNTSPFTENDELHPDDPYSLSKYEAEQGLLQIANETGMEVVIIRPPLVYGENAPGNFGSLVKWVNKFIPLPLGAINNQRYLVHLKILWILSHCVLIVLSKQRMRYF